MSGKRWPTLLEEALVTCTRLSDSEAQEQTIRRPFFAVFENELSHGLPPRGNRCIFRNCVPANPATRDTYT